MSDFLGKLDRCRTPWWRLLFARSTGCRDMDGAMLREGDVVVYVNASASTEPAYWNPVYEVVWNPPCLELQYIGGGKPPDIGSATFLLRHRSHRLVKDQLFDVSLLEGVAGRTNIV